ncbi:MAG: hypothetical protein ACYTHJ_08175 [Planctomycetota bacterium]|jgi:hypothetical protein
MSDSGQAQFEMVVKLRNSLKKVVELGYGDDECGQAVHVIFEDLSRQMISSQPKSANAEKLRIRPLQEHRTCNDLLAHTQELVGYVESQKRAEQNAGKLVFFPFITTLGITGGMFLLTFHAVRILPKIFSGMFST